MKKLFAIVAILGLVFSAQVSVAQGSKKSAKNDGKKKTEVVEKTFLEKTQDLKTSYLAAETLLNDTAEVAKLDSVGLATKKDELASLKEQLLASKEELSKEVFVLDSLRKDSTIAKEELAVREANFKAAEELLTFVEGFEEPEPIVDEVPVEAVTEGGIIGVHKGLKTKFIEGGPEFMALVSIALVIGLAFCIERIIYLSLAKVNAKKLMAAIADALSRGDIELAKTVCRNTAGPVASICYQGLLRVDDGLDVVERSVVSYGSLQSSKLESGCSWITLFIAMAPSLGFLGTVIGMVMAFDTIQREGDISPTIVAGGMKVALITTIYGIIVALILQVFYNFILVKIESIVADMEDSSITLLDLLTKYNLKK